MSTRVAQFDFDVWKKRRHVLTLTLTTRETRLDLHDSNTLVALDQSRLEIRFHPDI